MKTISINIEKTILAIKNGKGEPLFMLARSHCPKRVKKRAKNCSMEKSLSVMLHKPMTIFNLFSVSTQLHYIVVVAGIKIVLRNPTMINIV
jgi:hypothetical protein